MKPFCTVIIVTYNNERFVRRAIECLRKQARAVDQIILSDTGSLDTEYLYHFQDADVVIAGKDVGFCRGNNAAMEHVDPKCDYLFFLNPDAFLEEPFIDRAITYMESHPEYGAITGTTLGYNLDSDQPTGKYDTTGIFRTWYGKWYDRGQGDTIDPDLYKDEEKIPAICGAVFFCRMKALPSPEVMDPSFYMYKEDIDLSLKIRKMGWKLGFVPNLICYHCRGWNQDRKKMPRKFRLCSARNELTIQLKSLSFIGSLYSGLKYSAVKIFNL